MIRLLLAVLLISTASTAEARRRSDIVTDNCSSDRSWVAYRTAINGAIARRDTQALLRLVASDVSFDGGGGGGTGRAAFASHFGLGRPATSPLWRQLAGMMSLGCARGRLQPLYWVPSMFMDDGAPDDSTYGPQAAVIGAGVPLRAHASDASRLVARMSWNIVFLPDHDDGRGEWVHAILDNDRQGFVRRSQVHSLTGPYALFGRWRGHWYLVSFGYRE